MTQSIDQPYLPNGMQLLLAPVNGVKSVGIAMLIPGGTAHDPDHALGTAHLLTDLVTRGAGERDSRELTDAFDRLGVQRGESAEIMHSSFRAATLSSNLDPTLRLLADTVRRPRLESAQLKNCKQSTLQELKAIEDDPGQKLFIELKRRCLPNPLGQPTLGEEKHIAQLKLSTVKDFHRRHYRPNGSILAIVGDIDVDRSRALAEECFADWKLAAEQEPQVDDHKQGCFHLDADKVQTHIGIAFDSVSAGDPDYFNAHGAVGVLSGGMSARLNTEIREKRGLCYSVGASFVPLRDRGCILGYASTNAERADQTLEVFLAELDRLNEGITDAEVRRVKAGLKASLVMHEESTMARAGSLAQSWYNLGRVRTLQEIAAAIDRLTPKSILEYLERHPPGDYTIMTLGPAALEAAAS